MKAAYLPGMPNAITNHKEESPWHASAMGKFIHEGLCQRPLSMVDVLESRNQREQEK